MANVDQKNLIPLCILEVLRKYSDESHPLTHNMIIEHLVKDYNISPPPERKSIGRNLDNLRSQMEIDIEITPKGSYLVSREFEDYELRLLIDSVLSNKYISVIETRELVDKLKSLSGVYFDSYEEHLLTIDEKKKTDKRDLYLKLHIINDAIENGRDLCFELTENAEYPDWLLTRSYIEGFGNDTYDDDDELDRSAQIKPEYLVLMNNRYYVAFKAIILVNLGGDLVEELAYCGLDEMTNLSIAEHKPVILPKERSLLKRVEVSEDTVREMASRGVIERPGSNRIRADFLIDPPLKNKVVAAMGEPVIVTEYPGLFPQVRVVIDVDRNTFERFWWNHLTEIRLLGPEFEITWLKYMLRAAQESISDTELLKEMLGI